MDKFKIRPFEKADYVFIKESWRNNLQNSSRWHKDIPEELFKQRFLSYYYKLMDRKDIKIDIACLPDAEDVIIGYAIYDKNHLFWIYVKHSWRLMGVGKALFSPSTNECGRFLTYTGSLLASKYKVIYNPFMEE